MSESYSDRTRRGAVDNATAPMSGSTENARALIAELLPGVNAEQLVRALIAERDSVTEEHGTGRPRSAAADAAHELSRVRAQFALGDSARRLQHAFNNPLTALLAECQLLECESLNQAQGDAVARILALARRLVVLSRRLDAANGDGRMG
ncbi:MAG: hypothetical protein ABJA80_06270 [bacterium]